MKNASFMQYRVNAFNAFLGEQFRQLQQLGAMVGLFLQVAIPAFFLFLFMGLGKILVQEPALSSVLMVAILVAQCELSAALSHGVKDAKNRLFQRSLVSAKTRVLCDFLLSCVSNVSLLLSAILLVSVDANNLVQATHFMVFMVALLLGVQLATYKTQRVKAYVIILLLAFAISGVLSATHGENLWFLLVVAVASAAMLLALPEPKWLRKFSALKLGFWGRYHWHQQDQLWWRSLLLLGVYLGANVFHSHRPDLAFAMHSVALPAVLYIATSLQLNQNALMQHHGLWLESLGRPKSLVVGQFATPMLLMLIGVAVIQSVAFNVATLCGFLLAGTAVVFTAYKQPKYYAVSWLVISVVAGWGSYQFGGAF